MKNCTNTKVVILGAGLAGLAAGWKLSEKGVHVTLLEKNPQIGGLARTITKHDLSYDLGPHRFHTDNKDVFCSILELVGKSFFLQKSRKSSIWINSKSLFYPPQLKDILAKFSILTLFKIVLEYLLARTRKTLFRKNDSSFEKWTINRFGKKLYNLYFRDYTEKLWKLSPNKISSDWAAQRIPLMTLNSVIKGLFIPSQITSRSYTNIFNYPPNGIGELSKKMAEKIISGNGKIHTNAQIKKMVDTNKPVKSIEFYTSEKEKAVLSADFIVSTIPITEFTNLLQDESGDKHHPSKLKWMSLIFLYVLIRKPVFTNNHWIYFPEKKYLFNRISEIKNFSQNMIPSDKTLLCVEISTIFNSRTWNSTADEIFKTVEADLLHILSINSKDIEFFFIEKERYAYPFYALDYSTHLKDIFGYLDRFPKLFSIGRQGSFHYNNMDNSIEMGFNTARTICEQQ